MASSKDISLTQLRYFVAAARHGSMTEAAGELFVAQSAVSTSIAKLESALGSVLFVRKRAKGLQLTSAGQQFMTRAVRILGEVDDAVGSLATESLSGPFSAAIFPTIAPFYQPGVLDEFASAHPMIELQMRELSAEGIEDALHAHTVEAALTYDLGLSPAVHRERLGSVDLFVTLSSQHPLAARSAVSLRDVVDMPFILFDLPISRDYFLGAFRALGLRPRVRYRSSSFEAVRAMVARGHGFTLLNQRPLHDRTYDGGHVVVRPIVEETPQLDIVVASAETQERTSRKAQAFIEVSRDVLRRVDRVRHGADEEFAAIA